MVDKNFSPYFWKSEMDYFRTSWKDHVLTGNDLDTVALDGCYLIDINFDNCVIENSEFNETIMENIIIRTTHFDGCEYKGPGTRLENIRIIDSSLTDCYFSNVVFQDLKVTQKTIFTGAEFSNCTFINCDFRDTRFDQCKFHDVKFSECLFSGMYSHRRPQLCNQVTFNKCDFGMCDIYKCTIPRRTTRHGGSAISPEGKKSLKFIGCNTERLTFTDCTDLTGLDKYSINKDNIIETGSVNPQRQNRTWVSDKLKKEKLKNLETTVSAPKSKQSYNDDEDAYAAIYGGFGGAVDGYDCGAYDNWNKATEIHKPIKNPRKGFLFITSGV